MINKFRTDLMQAIREKNPVKKTVLQMLITGCTLESKKLCRDLNNDEVIGIINRELKQTRGAQDEFKKGNREDLVIEMEDQIRVLKSYLPEQLSTEEVEKIIKETIDSLDGTKNIGMIMKNLMPKIKGKADTKMVSQIVNKFIS